MDENLFASFISYKISKIRWKPENYEESEYFVTGSTDEEINQLTLWYYPINDDDQKSLPKKEVTQIHEGDVTDMKFISPRNLVVSSSNGGLLLLDVTHSEILTIKSWPQLHFFKNKEPAPCTGVASYEEDVASVGEDGRIVLLTITDQQPVRKFDHADGCALRCATFLKHSELITSNWRGQLKLWDLRRPTDDEALITSFVGVECAATTALTHHPTQRHVMLAGADDGSVSIWDLRKTTYPVNVIQAHSSTINEIMFHPERPEHLFTCSFGGEIWHWNNSRIIDLGSTNDAGWLKSDATKHRIEVTSLMTPSCKPINSMDINKWKIICGGDNESITFIKNLPLG